MKFYNIHKPEKKVNLTEAVLTGIQGSEGLFMPEYIPTLLDSFFEQLPQLSLQEIGIAVAEKFLSEDVSKTDIQNIVSEALNFPIPLVNVTENIYSLELFHGPTLAFKDVGARFMARLFSVLNKNSSEKIKILVATSGDTGGAVANAFFNVEGISVTILYPSGKVSALQEKQLTTLGKNISAIEVNGTFDDCQRLVKQAFADVSLQQKLKLASANSINLARLIPQSFYYFWAVAQAWKQNKKQAIAISVPSGNFGNITAGIIAQKMGLPISKFIAATNANNIVPQYLLNGNYEPKASVQTISNAMDVGNPSNFARMKVLFENSWEQMKASINGFYFSDKETKAAIRNLYTRFNYTADPHGAVGYLALAAYLKEEKNTTGIFLETAHPAKFIDVVEEALSEKIEIPQALSALASKQKVAGKIDADYEQLKAILLA
ncbi:MAG: threonine synthase [Chitinophagales bacterium]|nr:threonine synthase [Chitinophagales bacterium]HRP40218.1 threonine synthase [Chitinophagales bacterium]